jgi:hypothetical protein
VANRPVAAANVGGMAIDYGEDQAEGEYYKSKSSSQSHRNSPLRCLP